MIRGNMRRQGMTAAGLLPQGLMPALQSLGLRQSAAQRFVVSKGPLQGGPHSLFTSCTLPRFPTSFIDSDGCSLDYVLSVRGWKESAEEEAVLHDAAARTKALTSGLLPLRPGTEDARNRVAVP